MNPNSLHDADDPSGLLAANRALQAERDTYKAIADAVPFGSHVYDLIPSQELLLFAANRSADLILSFDHDALLRPISGNAFEDISHRNLGACLKRVAITGENLKDEFVSSVRGKELVLEIHASQLGLGRVGVFFRDVTELSNSYEEALEGWARAMDARDKETEGHSQRVTKMSLAIGRALGLAQSDLRNLRRGALVHDVGNIAIPDSVLLKPGKLTPEERSIIQTHAQIGFEMLKGIRVLQGALDVPHYHHERWDGTGYPERLKGDNIPLLARIFAIADVWDGMSSDRPYRRGFPPSFVFEEIQSQSGRHFDPAVVEAFERVVRLLDDDRYELINS